MPELPEVETIKNILKEMLIGKKIINIKFFHEKTIENDLRYFKQSLLNATIIDFKRVGKYLVFIFDNNKVMLSHLRMEGKYFLKEKGDNISIHDLVLFYFSDGSFLSYNDTRRFGTLKVANVSTYMNEEPMTKVGPDPFMMKDATLLYEAFKNKTTPIKQCITEQSIMSGLGNIYADEVLFASQIHPQTYAKDITKKQYEQILENSQIILKKAIISGGSTIKSYHPKKGVSGNFQVQLNVYDKGGQPCPKCGTILKKIFVGGRGTTYCPNCQKNISLPTIIGVTGPIGSGKSLICELISKKGYFYISADEVVHTLYKQSYIQKKIIELIPTLKIINNDIDRVYLKEYLLKNPYKKLRLEKFIHEETKNEILRIIKRHKKENKFVIEVPLLFESGFDEYCKKLFL